MDFGNWRQRLEALGSKVVDFVGLLKAAGQLVASLTGATRQAFTTALLTGIVFLFGYAGLHVVRNGFNVVEGLRSAFLDTTVEQEARAQDMRNVLMQAELRQVAASDRLINQLLSTLLEKVPNVARVRLSVIHNGVTGLTGIGLMRFDVTHATAAPGRSSGELVANVPLSEWNEYLPDLIAGRCKYMAVSEMGSYPARARLMVMNMAAFLACPVTDIQGRMLGGVFLSWDQRDPLPNPEELAKIAQYTTIVGLQLAAALDLRVAPALPPVQKAKQ